MVNDSAFARVLMPVLIVLLASCTTVSTPDSPSAPAAEPPRTSSSPSVTQPQPPTRPPQPSISSAWQPLVDKAQQAAARGDYEQAFALLERAQRIDPESSEIYLQMARTHRAKGDLELARATAERGMLYCRNSAQCDELRLFIR